MTKRLREETAGRVASDRALVALQPEPVPVSALSGDDPSRIQRVLAAWAKIGSVTTNETESYAELYFGEHQTQAMTMRPQDWHELSAALDDLKACYHG